MAFINKNIINGRSNIKINNRIKNRMGKLISNLTKTSNLSRNEVSNNNHVENNKNMTNRNFGSNTMFRKNNILNGMLWNKNRCIYTLISKENAANLIKTDSVILIDVRTKEEYEAVHIQNAINIPVEELKESIKSVNVSQSKKIMIYCSNGSRSKTAINILNSMGYTNILIWEYSSLATFPYQEMLVYIK